MQQQEYGLKAEPGPRAQNIHTVLERELDEGEEILWSAQPSPQSHNRPAPARVFIILGSIFGSIGMLLVVLGIIFLVIHIGGASIPLLATGGTFFVMGLIYSIVAIFLKIPLKNTIYAVTGQRILVVQTGSNTTVDSYSKKDIGQITTIERPDGTGDIFFQGNSGSLSYNQNQGYNYSNNNAGSSGSWSSGINKGKLLGIAGVKGVERLIRKTFLQDTPPTAPYQKERGYTGSDLSNSY